MAKVLITGGAGFIGSHLVERLLEEGNQVIVVDDLTEGKLANLPVHNPNLKFYKKSILEPIGNLFKGVDAVFHLAALPRPELSIRDPKPANKVNVEGTLNILLFCRDYGVRRVVAASSASVYGEQEKFPSTEKMTPNPISPYGLHKLILEQYCRLFGKIYGLQTNCLRFFNVYGKRMPPNGEYASLIPAVIKHVKSNKPATIYGDGEQIRDFIYVGDVVEAMILASKSKIFGEVFNIGYGENMSVNDIYKLICDKLGRTIEPIHKPARIEPRVTLSDCRKAKKLLGWEPKVSFEQGIEKTLSQKPG
jgi:UDP-glucose 4-epimerase